MNQHEFAEARQIADVVGASQAQTTGHPPSVVTAVFNEDVLVITLRGALTPAEIDLAKSSDGAARMLEYHQQLFAASSESLRKQIRRITGRHVRAATVDVAPKSGAMMHAFTTGTVVQVFLLDGGAADDASVEAGAQSV